MFGSKSRHQSRIKRNNRTSARYSLISDYNTTFSVLSPTASTVSIDTLSERSNSYATLDNRVSSESSCNEMNQLRISDNDSPTNDRTINNNTSTSNSNDSSTNSITSLHYKHDTTIHECLSDAYNNSHPQWSHNCVLRGDQWLRVLRPERLRKRFIGGTYAKLARQYEKLNDYPIRKDLSRTYPTHPLFIGAALDDSVEYHSDSDMNGAGRPMLYNLLRAYAAYDIDIGYSQGLAFIAAFLIMHIPNDELAFYSLVIIMLNQQYNIRWLYENDCINLQSMFSAFECMMALHTPRAYKHMQQQSVQPSMFSTQWFLTLFCYRVSYHFTATLWDSIILDSQYTVYDGRNKKIVTANSGHLLIRLLQTATAVIKYYENHLCTLEFDELVPLLSNPPALDSSLIKLSTTLIVPPSIQQLLKSALLLPANSSPHTKIRNRLQHTSSTINRRRNNRNKSFAARTQSQFSSANTAVT